MSLLKSLAAAAALTVLVSASAFAHQYKLGDLVIHHPWTRATPPKAMAAGGFAAIENTGSDDDRLISVSTPVAGRAEIHEMAVNNGVMTMRQSENGFAVPAGATSEMKPGGFHMMLMDLKQPLVEGEKVPVTLTFEKAGEVTVELAVEKLGAKGMDNSKMDHGNMKTMDHSQHGKN